MSETTIVGTECRIYPSQRQAAKLDLQRRRNRALWNLLLELQQAAYNGENTRSRLGWRKIWGRTVQEDYVEAERVYREGKVTKSGMVKKEPGIGREDERERLKAKLKDLEKQKKKNTPEFEALKKQINRIAGQPKPVDPALLERIDWKWRWDGAPLKESLMHKLFGYLARQQCDHTHKHTLAWLAMRKLSAKADEVIAWLQSHDGTCDCAAAKASKERYAEISKEVQPRLLWAGQSSMMVLQKIMAQLKQHPQTRWIKDLSSHTAQKTVKDMVGAIDNMLRERGKAARGEPSRKTGFPRFKPNHYAAGSAYFANTQLKFRHKVKRKADHDERVIKKFSCVQLPNGIGWMECRLRPDIAAAHEYGEADLMGARVWRQGEKWFMSCQWRLPVPEALPATGRIAAVKIAAAIPITVYDDRGQTREYTMPPIDPETLAGHKFVGRKQARQLECARARQQRKLALRQKRHQAKLDAGMITKPPKVRIRLTPRWRKSAARLARFEAADANVRNNWLHETTTAIVEKYDVIAVHDMEVAKMMKKPRVKQEAEADQPRKRRSLKAARVLMRRAAMARIKTMLASKAKGRRGEAAYEELPSTRTTMQPCSRCGVIHTEMKDGRRMLRCDEPLPDGTVCGNRLTRNRNGARNVMHELERLIERRRGDA